MLNYWLLMNSVGGQPLSRDEYLLMGPPAFTGRVGVNGHVDGPVQTHTGVDVRKSCSGVDGVCVCAGVAR